MERFFDLIDRFKFGILATGITYMGIFMYLNIASYKKTFPIQAWPSSYVEKMPEEIEIKPENVEVSSSDPGEAAKNIVNDMNDKRDRSYEKFSSAEVAAAEAQKVKDYEKQLYSDAKAGRDKAGQKPVEKLTPRESELLKQAKANAANTSNAATAKNAYKGKALVSFSLDGRKGNSLPAPSYKCGVGQTGLVYIAITVNQSGVVVSARYEAGSSNAATECMIQEGLAYAKRSKFNYSASAPAAQSGYITYEFISQ